MTNNKPALKLTDGRISATVWRNPSPDPKGQKVFYSVQISRAYQDEHGNWKDSDRFSGAELLRVARLAEKAYDAASELRKTDSDA